MQVNRFNLWIYIVYRDKHIRYYHRKILIYSIFLLQLSGLHINSSFFFKERVALLLFLFIFFFFFLGGGKGLFEKETI